MSRSRTCFYKTCRMAIELLPYQHIDRAASTVDRARGAKGQHRLGPLHPLLDDVLQHRTARPGATSFAVNDAHAGELAGERFGDEVAQSRARFNCRESVQIDFAVHGKLAAPKFREDRFWNVRPAKAKLIARA